MADDGKYLGCSYIYRKALIRKHYLSNTIRMFTAKNPDSILKQAYPESFTIEVDYAEFLDDALDEAYELRGEIESGEKTWILKPSMSDRGQGIRLFNTIEEMQAIFDEFDEGVVTDDEDEDVEGEENDHGVITSQLRHFVVQEYLDNPLLLPAHNNRKFHIRTYVLCVGAIKVYVYKEMLALFALSKYSKPLVDEDTGIIDLIGHLTNTCLQGESKDEGSVKRFWDLECDEELKRKVFEQICSISGDLFKAASAVDRINFQPLPNAFEIYGVDFLVNDDLSVHVLEVNAYPDFKHTGDDLNDIILSLFRSVYTLAIRGFYGEKGGEEEEDDKCVLVLDHNISGGW